MLFLYRSSIPGAMRGESTVTVRFAGEENVRASSRHDRIIRQKVLATPFGGSIRCS
jgi:hypothetical protein